METISSECYVFSYETMQWEANSWLSIFYLFVLCTEIARLYRNREPNGVLYINTVETVYINTVSTAL